MAFITPGIKNILLASVFFGIINACVKYYSHIPAIEIVFFRSLVSFVLSFITVKSLKLTIFPKNELPLLVARGFFGVVALSLYFYCIQNMPLATAVTILYTAPIFTIIIAIFMNGDKVSKLQWPFIIMAFIGTAMTKGFDERVSILHFSLCLLAAIFASMAYNIIRKLKGRANPHLIIFYFPFVSLPVILPILIPNWVTPNFTDCLGLIGIGVFTQIAQIFMTKAYMQEPASKIGHFNYLTSVYAWACGIFIFHEEVSLISTLGLILIIIGVIFSTRIGNNT